ncbi:MAG: VPEID-CTERM sorting domain-containing protein [Gemmobacter sp.]|nr:VPEID-CTERM sorting domain-containing protein [Gemmobacter sp.]
MTRVITTLALAGSALAASVSTAAAQVQGGRCSIFSIWNCFGHGGGSGSTTPANVPEIDASAGLLAIAALTAVMLLAWERRSRAR